MKKSLFVAAALATISISGAASALDTQVVRQIRSAGLQAASSLGSVTFTALGASAESCVYLANWESPFNPNEVALCVVRERRTPVNPSCSFNAFQDFATFVSAGPGALGVDTTCGGFDTLGIAYTDISIQAGESPTSSVLQGVAVFPTALPLVHAIEVA